MSRRVATFVELGRRLASFGEDERSRGVILSAVEQNPWFSEAEVRRSVSTICQTMLSGELLEQWLMPYAQREISPKRVLVVMAGNIPFVGFYDLMCVLIVGHTAVVKTSSKDSVLMHYVVDILRDIDPSVNVEWAEEHSSVDAVIATGSDNANRYFKTKYADIPSLLRANRHSVGVLSTCATEEQISALADDIFAYSGLGCRNVSLVFVPRGIDFDMVAPKMGEKFRNNYLQQRALLTMQGREFFDVGEALLIEQDEFPRSLSEVSIIRYDSLEQVHEWLQEHDSQIQCVVSDVVSHSRCVGFGQAQSPLLSDSPDEVDVIDFILNI